MNLNFESTLKWYIKKKYYKEFSRKDKHVFISLNDKSLCKVFWVECDDIALTIKI